MAALAEWTIGFPAYRQAGKVLGCGSFRNGLRMLVENGVISAAWNV